MSSSPIHDPHKQQSQIVLPAQFLDISQQLQDLKQEAIVPTDQVTPIREETNLSHIGDAIRVDEETIHPVVRKRWTDKINPFQSTRVPPIPPERAITREYKASLFSFLFFQWLAPLLSVGYKRPLELNDVWAVSPDQQVALLAERFMNALALQRRKKTRIHSFVLAMFNAFRKDFIVSASCMVVTACLQLLTPFTLRYLILFVQDAYDARLTGNDHSIGRGIGLVVGITCMQILESLCLNHFYYHSMILGAKVRSTLIACISEKSMKLSNRARVGNDTEEGWSNGRINNLMSTDTSRLDNSCYSVHRCWSAPLQITLALALLCINLTYSALVGFAIICTILPLIGRVVKSQKSVRNEINKLTDQRISLTQEAFSAIRVVKLFAWESKLEERLSDIRKAETNRMAYMFALRNAIVIGGSTTVLAAEMLSFVTYYLTNHELSAAPVFSSFALFQALAVPIEMLPMALGRVVDAYASVKRIDAFLNAEEMVDKTVWNEDDKFAIRVEHADFSWNEGVNEPTVHEIELSDEKDGESIMMGSELAGDASSSNHVASEFQLKDIHLSVQRHELIAVIGSVGAGKSSLLSALAGDMQTTRGKVVLGASRAFCSQTPWIQNNTVRQNIIFGQPFYQDRYDEVVRACALDPDINMLPNGDLTEIGERGITLSGGQKQRLNVARAIYRNTDVVLLDDPLSAVDAHVGHHIMDNAICHLLGSKARILATHQLHFLRRADRIVWMREGRIYKVATYADLIEKDAGFRILMEASSKGNKHKVEERQTTEEVSGKNPAVKPDVTALMQQEERATGSVKWAVYKSFIQASGSMWNIGLILFLLAIGTGVSTLTTVWLSWWTSGHYSRSDSEYIGIYATLGFAGAFLMFTYGTVLSTLCFRAGHRMLRQAIARTIRAPVSFFDTTPLGRITNRFSKDVDTVDNSLVIDVIYGFYIMASLFSVFGLAIAYYPYFAIALVPLGVAFMFSDAYYRKSAREIKRHEAVLRSTVFSRFGEVITGILTIRAYGVQKAFQSSIVEALDAMDGAYFLTFAGQRWLSVRLDAAANTLIFIIGILIVTSRFAVSPSTAGLVLAYMLSIGTIIQESVHSIADVQNDMNAVERLKYYASELEQEQKAGINPAPTWPARGAISFKDVELRYRSGLPLVLKKLSFDAKPGERVGIVGRTGAGKSSIMVALFRLAELSSGRIDIDDMDISKVGVYDLRSRLAMIPQDPALFKGTIRSNLDPFNEHEDLELWNALRQADLLNNETVEASKDQEGLTLDSVVEEEGNNYSLGQRQLLALARVLVRDTRIVLCDEATSSVDFETDLRVQRTMLRAFKGKTLLCIAHRLKTIIGYDRILVMDAGTVADYDTPLSLFDKGGIFRGMCDRSGITRHDLLRNSLAEST